MTTKFNKQVHLDELPHLHLCRLILVTSRLQNHVNLKICTNYFSARNVINNFGQNDKKSHQFCLEPLENVSRG